MHQTSTEAPGTTEDCILPKTYSYVIKATHHFFEDTVIYNHNSSPICHKIGTDNSIFIVLKKNTKGLMFYRQV